MGGAGRGVQRLGGGQQGSGTVGLKGKRKACATATSSLLGGAGLGAQGRGLAATVTKRPEGGNSPLCRAGCGL